jgi:hypothetical protein
MSDITHEETFAARDLMQPVEVCTTKTKTGEEIYLLHLGGMGIDHEMSREEAKGLRDALSMALDTHQ